MSEDEPAETTNGNQTTEHVVERDDSGGNSRRTILATLLGIGGLGVIETSRRAGAKSPKPRPWNQDVDARGNDLFNLGSLTMAANEAEITDFEGDGLSIDADGNLNTDLDLDSIDAGTLDGVDWNDVDGRYLQWDADKQTLGFTGAAEWENTGSSTNAATGKFASVGGGDSNTADSEGATVGGGESNEASGRDATIGGGNENSATAPSATVGGGLDNVANGREAAIGGGRENTASGVGVTLSGGRENKAAGTFGTVGGGRLNETSDRSATVGGGEENTASGRMAVVGGGERNKATGITATIGGGEANEARSEEATVGGGVRQTCRPVRGPPLREAIEIEPADLTRPLVED